MSAPAFLIYNKVVKSDPEKHKRRRKRKLKQSETSPVIKKSLLQQESQEIVPIKQNGTKSRKKKATKPKTVVLEEEKCEEPEKITQSDDPIKDSINLLKWVINPVTPETFFNKFWEKKMLHIKRPNSPNYYASILDSEALDKILRFNQLYYTRNVDVVSYENGVKEVHNQEGKATASALWDFYSNGCSIRILNPQTYNRKVHLLLTTLQEYFGTMVGANVYLTPANSQGFAPHFDDIEAFILQLEGRKHWKLYYPKKSEMLARNSSGNFKREEIGEPFMELTLNAGELLYFPRGIIHEGRTDPNSHSLHITVSVYQKTCFTDLLENILPLALQKASENNIEFRKGLPLHYLKGCGSTASDKFRECRDFVQQKVGSLVEIMMGFLDVDKGADLLGRKLIRDSMPPILSTAEAQRSSKLDGPQLKSGIVHNRVEINLETKIRLLRYYCIRLVCEENCNPRLYYNTENGKVYHEEEEQWLELEPQMVPTVQSLQKFYPSYVEINELPMEDELMKLQLISDLWEHGIIVTEDFLSESL